MKNKIYLSKTLASFFLVLFTMPLGHALMMLMEHFMSPTALHYSAFLMGLTGFMVTVCGVFVKGDTKQTLFGLAGGLLFWTGWVEFMLGYYAHRYGTLYDLTGSGTVTSTIEYINGVVVDRHMYINGQDIAEMSRQELKTLRGSRPEYLTMPGTFGFFMMFVLLYTFCIRSGCNAFNWLQKKLFRDKRDIIVFKPMTRHTSIVTFMELNMIMWASYLLLMFCYDPVFLGDSHPITIVISIFCLAGSFFMFKRELKIGAWGPNIRMAIATVIVFWTFVEVMGRNKILNEIWIAPLEHQTEMWSIFIAFLVLIAYLLIHNRAKTRKETDHTDIC